MTNKTKDVVVKEPNVADFIPPSQIDQGVTALFEFLTNRESTAKKTQLFGDDPQLIYLQLAQFQIPTTPKVDLRVTIPHSLSDGKDVCLIVRNIKSGKKNDHERTINHYQNLLKFGGFPGSIKIIPIGQLADHHTQYEQKTKFARIYDTHLVDGRLLGVSRRILGLGFSKSGKHLIPLDMSTKGFKNNLKKALNKSVMTVHAKGDTVSIKIGYTSMTPKQLRDNILSAISGLCRKDMLPGGMDNIRAAYVKTARSLAVPIYLSRKKHNSVAKPVRKVKIPKAYKVVEGELSTVIGGVVRVNPEGEVDLRKVLTDEDRMMLEDAENDDATEEETKKEENSEPESEEEEPETDAKPLKRKLADEESDDDEEVEAAEENYINEMEGGFGGEDSDEDEESKETAPEAVNEAITSPKSKKRNRK